MANTTIHHVPRVTRTKWGARRKKKHDKSCDSSKKLCHLCISISIITFVLTKEFPPHDIMFATIWAILYSFHATERTNCVIKFQARIQFTINFNYSTMSELDPERVNQTETQNVNQTALIRKSISILINFCCLAFWRVYIIYRYIIVISLQCTLLCL